MTLAELGAAIAVLDVAESGAATATELRRCHGVEACALNVDLTDEEAVRTVPRLVSDTLGRLDILVHCAGLVGSTELHGWNAPFADQGSAAWRMALEVNL